MKFSSFCALLILILATSCHKSKDSYLLLYTAPAPLGVITSVNFKGLEIGKVNEIGIIDKGHCNIEILLDEALSIPTDSKFILKESFLDEYYIEIELGQSEQLASSKDTLVLDREEVIEAESINIMTELKRLNDNMETLLKEK